MATTIHPLACVEEGAQFGADVEIGAFAYIGGQVTLGDGCKVHHHGTVEGHTVLGPACEVFPYTAIGTKTQDLKFSGGTPGLTVGARNQFREYVTIHGGTKDGHHTILGDDNVILAYSHVAHDCVVGNRLIMSSHAAFAGSVTVGNHVNIAWGSGVHQFGRVGDHAMIGAMTKTVQDVLPYMIADGIPAVIHTYNKIGLTRAGFSTEAISRIKAAFKLIYRSGLNRSQALEQLRARPDAGEPELAAIIEFAATSKRGLCSGVRG